jgi:DNA-binding transcriptional MocR family regulator
MAFLQSFEYKLRNASSATNLHHSLIDAEIISELINSGVYEEVQLQKKELSRNYNERYDKIFEVKEENTNHHSLFRWLKIQCNPENFLSQLKDEGIQVMESALFNAGTDQPNGFIRIALSSVSNDFILEKALLRIKQLNKLA